MSAVEIHFSIANIYSSCNIVKVLFRSLPTTGIKWRSFCVVRVCGCAIVVYHVPHLILISGGEHEESVCGTVDGLILSAFVLALCCTVPTKNDWDPSRWP